jgi:hypothetical protein
MRCVGVKLVRKVIALGLAAAASSVVGCSSTPTDGRSGAGSTNTAPEEGTGEIHLQLTLPGGEGINAVAYSVTNGTPLGTVTGTYVLPASAVTADFEVPDVPAGMGYSLVLTATSTDGSVTCQGSAPATLPVSDASPGFAIATGTLTAVNVLLTCTETSDGGTSD